MPFPKRFRVFLPALAALAVLVACNPLTLRRNDAVNYVVRYAGPSGGWLEVSSSGAPGLDLQFRLLVDTPDDSARSCRDAATGAVEACELWGGSSVSDGYPVTTDAYRTTYSPGDD